MKWPPLIDSTHLPWWVVARDTLATLLAWFVLLYFIRDMAWMLAYWSLRALGIELPSPWAPGKMLRDVAPFLKLVAVMTVWLGVFAAARWHLLTNRQGAASAPAPLDPAELPATFGLSADTLALMRRARCCAVSGVEPDSGRGGVRTVVSEVTVSAQRDEP